MSALVLSRIRCYVVMIKFYQTLFKNKIIYNQYNKYKILKTVRIICTYTKDTCLYLWFTPIEQKR